MLGADSELELGDFQIDQFQFCQLDDRSLDGALADVEVLGDRFRACLFELVPEWVESSQMVEDS